MPAAFAPFKVNPKRPFSEAVPKVSVTVALPDCVVSATETAVMVTLPPGRLVKAEPYKHRYY